VSKNTKNNINTSVESNNSHEASQQTNIFPNNATLLEQQLLLNQMLQNKNQEQDDEIDLGELWRAIWAGKITIIIISFLFAVGSVLFALSKPNIYKATTTLAPVSVDGGSGGLAALAGKFGGLASMAGINLGGGGGDKTTLALEILKSRFFIENFITKHHLLVPVMAAKKWDVVTNTLILDDEIYDKSNKKWVREVKAPKKAKPSSWETYKAFSDLFSISQDKTSSIITASIEYYSPEMAKQWLNWLIHDINEFMREQDKQEAQDSINYLKRQLKNIQITSMETVFYQLIEEQTKNMMLIEVKPEYVLKTIDPAQVPDEKAKPKRALIVVLGTMLGGMLSILIVLIRYFKNKSRLK